jgi:hypothetical protein
MQRDFKNGGTLITGPKSRVRTGGDRSKHHVIEEATAATATRALAFVAIDSID